MRNKSLVICLAVGMVGLVLAATACGGSSKKTTNATATKAGVNTPAASATTSGAKSQVAVNLVEYKIQPQPASVAAGSVTFNIKNLGTTEHEMVILKTDLGPTALPTKADGSADEGGPGVTHVDEAESMAGGDSRSLTVDLAPGRYVLMCNIVQEVNGQTVLHYAKDMTVAFTVTQ